MAGHRFKRAAIAAIAALTLASASTAQPFNPGSVSAPPSNTAPADQDPDRPRRQVLPPGETPPPPVYKLVCAWRADGRPVTSRFQRTLGDGGSCSVSETATIGSRCRCGARRGNVVQVPVI